MARPAPGATDTPRCRTPRCLWALGTAALLAACGVLSSHLAPTTTVPPTTRVVTTTTTTAPLIRYQVRRGDSLTAIARRFGVSVDAIVAINHLTDMDKITEGQVLAIPPAPPLAFVITPANGQEGTLFHLKVTGAKPGETIVFEISPPAGAKFKGPPHTATPDGSVTAGYMTSPADPPGAYSVVATGSRGTSARAGFRLDATPATTTSTTRGSL